MYEQAFNLNNRPFTSAPYVKHYFAASRIQQTLDTCRMSVSRGSGPVIVVGAHGTGKTLMLAILAEEFHSQFRVVNLSVSHLETRAELLQSILFEVQQAYRGMSESEMRLSLIEYVKTSDACGSGLLLLVDDGQKLSRETIEELQLLTNFIRDGQPRVRLVLAGSNALEERLMDPKLESFNQRISARSYLGCLTGEETEAYVRAHIERAGGDPADLFDVEAFRAIRECTEGRPRYINQVCDHAMIFAATRGVIPITDSLVREAWMDVQQLPCGHIASPTPMDAQQDGQASNEAVKIEEAEGWTVLEFGELGGETTAEEAPAHTIENVDHIEAQPFESTKPHEETYSPGEELPVPVEPVEEFATTGFEDTFQSNFSEPVQQAQAEDPVASESDTLEELRAIVAGLGLEGEEQQTESLKTETVLPENPLAEPEVEYEAVGFVDEPDAVAYSSPQVPEESPTEIASDVPTVEGGAAILAAALQNFGGFQSDSPAEENVQPSQLPGPIESVLELQSHESIEPVFEQSVLETTQPVAQFEQAEEPAATTEVPVEHETFVESEPTAHSEPVADDPFGNDYFQDEEVLANTYSPFIASQNQKSLDVTSENLLQIAPSDAGVEPSAGFPTSTSQPTSTAPPAHGGYEESTPANESPAIDAASADEAFPTFESALKPEVVREPIKPEPIEREMQETRYEQEGNGPASLTDEFQVVETSNEESVLEVNTVPVEYAPASNIVPLDPNEGWKEPEVPTRNVADEVGSILMTPLQERVIAAASEPEIKNGSGYHEQAGSPEDPEIRRQAEEIIRSLNQAVTDEYGGVNESDEETVSHETTEGLSPQQETAAIENVIQQSVDQIDTQGAEPADTPQIVMPTFDAQHSSETETPQFHARAELYSMSDQFASSSSTGIPESPAQQYESEPPASQEPPAVLGRRGFQPVPDSSATPAVEATSSDQQVLNEILEQSSLLGAQQAEPTHADDSDILNINSQLRPAQAQEPKSEQELPAYSQQEPSTGEAARVDYQKLFDQLRNVDQNQ